MLPATVSENRNGSSSTTAIALRSDTTSTSRTSAPSISTAPERGSYSRGSSWTSVVLPDPVAPTSAIVEPGSTVSDTSRRASGPVP